MKLILNGCLGRMGRAVSELAPSRDCTVVAGVDIAAADGA